MRTRFILWRAALVAAVACGLNLAAEPAVPGPAVSVARLPAREVTVFKDGYAFMAYEGRLPVNDAGEMTLEALPGAVLGTFWTYATDAGSRLVSVTASRSRVGVVRTALTLRELLEGNTGAEVFITETNGLRYGATILGFPERPVEELAASEAPGLGEALPQRGVLVFLKTGEGVKAMPVGRIQDVTFRERPAGKARQEELRSVLTVKMQGGAGAPVKAGGTGVGLVCLQKGVRWIPSYRVDLDGKGRARIWLQAAVVNELADLEDVTMNLVIGVPSFAFKETLDPMALQESAAQLSAFFQTDPARAGRGSLLAANFGNAVMSQVANMSDYRGQPAPQAGGVGLPEGARNEDLFVFTLKHISLKKGARMVLPVAEADVSYADVFALDLPFAPPPELVRAAESQRQAELARLLNAPKVEHKIRLANKSPHPFTTAPALVLREGRVVAQGMMTYASPGGSADLTLTTALDIQVKKMDLETNRTPNAVRFNGSGFCRVDVQGTVRLINRRGHPLTVAVTRHVLGALDSAGQGGKVEMRSAFDRHEAMAAGDGAPYYWWSWFGWPWWWNEVNGLGRVTWEVKLDPGQEAGLECAWHYFWL